MSEYQFCNIYSLRWITTYKTLYQCCLLTWRRPDSQIHLPLQAQLPYQLVKLTKKPKQSLPSKMMQSTRRARESKFKEANNIKSRHISKARPIGNHAQACFQSQQSLILWIYRFDMQFINFQHVFQFFLLVRAFFWNFERFLDMGHRGSPWAIQVMQLGFYL